MFRIPRGPAYAPETETATATETPKSKRKANVAKAAKPTKVRAKAAKVAIAKPAVAATPRKARQSPKFDQSKLDVYGFRQDSLKSKAAAMYASKGGATLTEVREALNSTQFNLLTQLREQGWQIDEKDEDSGGKRRHTRYFIRKK